MVDLGSKADINAKHRLGRSLGASIRGPVLDGEAEPFYDGTTKETWPFSSGAVTEGKGGTVTQKLVSWKIPCATFASG
jgi:hypothetical protein